MLPGNAVRMLFINGFYSGDEHTKLVVDEINKKFDKRLG